MTKTPLTSILGQFFTFISYAFLTLAAGIIIYSIIIKDWSGLIAGFVFGIFNYIIFARKLLRAKTITFDADYFYLKDGSKIKISQIKHIQNGKITYIDNDVEKSLFVNPFYASKRHDLFYKYFKLKKQ